MAKAMLLNVLVGVLGEFVEGLTEDNLKLGVFSGKIVLKHLQLKKEGIEKLKLPLAVKKGHLESLELKIPWTSLDSQPVRIYISGVYLLLSPVNKSNFDHNEASLSSMKKKQADILKAEKRIELAAMINSEAGEGKKKNNYFSNLAKKIVDNLEVKLCNIHVRYEDDSTIPGEAFCCGVTLDSFVIATTNSDWTEAFVNRASKKGSSINYKLAKSSNLGVYWNVKSEMYSQLTDEEWRNVMQCNPSTDGETNCRKFGEKNTYIIQPSNFGQLKLTHDEKPNVVPQLSIKFESSDLKLQLDKLQMRQSMTVIFAMQKMQEKMDLLVYRPSKSAVESPWEWWKYCLILMANKPDLLENKEKTAQLCCQHRKRYMELLKKHKLALEKNSKAVLDSTEVEEIEKIEVILPLHALIVYRQLVAKDLALLHHQMNQDKEKSKTSKKVSNFFRNHFGSKKKSEEDESLDEHDISLQTLQHELEDVLQSSDLDVDTLTLNFTADVCQSLHLTSDWKPLVDLNASFTLDAQIRPSYFKSNLAMTNLIIADRITENSVLPNLLSWQLAHTTICDENAKPEDMQSFSSVDSLSPFALSITKEGNAMCIRASSLPVEFCLNKPCVHELIKLALYVFDSEDLRAKLDANVQEVVQLYEDGRRRALRRAYLLKQRLEDGESNQKELKHNDSALGSSEVTSDGLSIDISVELSAPKFIIPQQSDNDSMGCLRLDMGHLSLKGLVIQGKTNTMNWTVSLSSISADMPSSISDMYVGILESQLSEHSAETLQTVLSSRRDKHNSQGVPVNYLIKPFGVVLDAKVSDTATSVVSIAVSIDPEIDSEIDVDKLLRLLSLSHSLATLMPESQTTAQHDDTDSINMERDHENSMPPVKRLGSIQRRRHNANKSNIDLDEVTCLLELKIVVPCVNLIMVYDSSDTSRSYVDISLQEFDFLLKNRGYDMHLNFDLGRIQVRDSLRAKEQECIIYSANNPTHSELDHPPSGDQLIHISLQYIKSVKSPLYDPDDSCGFTICAEFGKLHLIADQSSIMHFKPFVDIFTSSSPSPSESTPDSRGNDSIENNKNSYAASDTCPSGMTITLRFHELSLSLLQHNCFNYSRRVPLNQVFSFSFQDLATDVQIHGEQIRAELGVKNFSLYDTRDNSESFYYRSVIRPMNDGYIAVSPDVSNSDSCSELVRFSGSDQLFLLFEQHAAKAMSISAILRSLCIYVSVDTVMDISATVVENINAFLHLVQPIESSSMPSQDLQCDSAQATDVQPNEHPQNIKAEFRVPNPQLVFLEDPTLESSKAIIFRTNIDMSLTQNCRQDDSSEEAVQAISASVYDMEVFVLSDVSKWIPHQVLAPTRVEFGFNQTLSRGKIISNSSCINADAFDLSLSLNDILLTQSILMRRALSPPTDASIRIESSTKATTTSSKVQEAAQLFFLKAVFNMRTANFTLVNDFLGYDIPLFKLKLDEIAFKLDGFLQDMSGSGFLTLMMEYYNPKVVEWEPVVESWQPEINVKMTSDDIGISLNTHQTLQMNVTSTLLEGISQAYAMLITQDPLSPSSTRKISPTIAFVNKLGISITLIDSFTKNQLFTLDPGNNVNDKAMVSPKNMEGKLYVGSKFESVIRMQEEDSVCSVVDHYPKSIDVLIDQSTLITEKTTVLNLPTREIKSCISYPLEELTLDELRDAFVASTEVPNGEPRRVVEEVYEYERYNPLAFSWTDPFIMNDPPHYGDKRGSRRETPKHSFKLPSDGHWEWETPWKVDGDSWEYAHTFEDLIDAKIPIRRKNQTLDCARRRRWIRTRVSFPNAGQEKEGSNRKATLTSNCSLVWKTTVKEDGSRLIEMRSAIEVKNCLPYQVKIQLKNGTQLGPLDEYASISVPLPLVKHASSICFQPLGFTCGWSAWVACDLRETDYSEKVDICAPLGTEGNAFDKSVSSCGEGESYELPIRCFKRQKSRAITVSLFSHVEIINALPCSLHFKIARSKSAMAKQDIVDQKVLHAGESYRLLHTSLKNTGLMSIHLPGSYGWSEPVDLMSFDKKGRVNIVFHDPSSESSEKMLLIRLQVNLKGSCASTVEVFSNSAFVDYTGLDLAIAAVVNKKTKETIKRKSYGDSSFYRVSEKVDSSMLNELEVLDMTVKSKLSYKTAKNASLGKMVYTDRDMEFTYLPEFLLDQTYVQTACNDRTVLVEGSSFLHFKVNKMCLVFLLFDIRVTQLPLWLESQGFHAIKGERVVASGFSISNTSEEINFALFGKFFGQNDHVMLGCNYSADAREMYSVFVVPTDANSSGTVSPSLKEVAEQVNHASITSSNARESGIDPCNLADASWVEGGHGCTLFNTETGRVVVGVKRGTVWANNEINLRGLNSSSRKNGPFDIHDKVNGICYQFVFTVHFLPSLFRRTKILTVMPRYCIINSLLEPVHIRQYDKNLSFVEDFDASKSTCAKPFRTTGWHQLRDDLSTKVQIKLADTYWSWGYFDINSVGSYSVLLTRRCDSSSEYGSNSSQPDILESQDPVVINVDVKLASADDKCAVSIVLWAPSSAANTELSITNDSKYPISVAQDGVLSEIKKTASSKNRKDVMLFPRLKEFVLQIPPHTSIPYGWAFPAASAKKKVIIGIVKDSLSPYSSKNKASLNVSESESEVPIYFPRSDVRKKEERRATARIEFHNCGRVIKIFGNDDLSQSAIAEDAELLNSFSLSSRSRNSAAVLSSSFDNFINDDMEGSSVSGSTDDVKEIALKLSAPPSGNSKEMSFSLSFVSVGLSIIADRPTRRELLSLYIKDLSQNVSKVDHVLSVETKISDIQVDNYSETASFPVAFRSISNEKNANIPFFHFAMLRESDNDSVKFKYLTARLLEFAIEIDSGTILLLLSDLLGDVKFLTPDQALSYVNPQGWISRYNRRITSPIATRELTSVYEAQRFVNQSRFFFGQIILHPIRVSLSFMQTDLPKGRMETLTSSNALDTVMSVATVNCMEIKLNSFIVSNAVESMSSLQDRIVAKAVTDITRQLAQIVGSLLLFGNPANLVSNIGNGVQGFFYEPYLGMVQSPIDFLKGVHKGTQGLVSGVVSGALTSAAAIVGTASSGISYLSGDQDFVRERAKQRQKQQASRGGVLKGFKNGGEAIVSGFASGISGIVTKPMEGAEKEGVGGFFKGIGKGIMGVAVKPVLGVTDGVTNVVEGISNQVGNVNTGGYVHIRPPRALDKSKKDENFHVVSGLNLLAAEAQQFTLKYANKKSIQGGDEFYCHLVIDGTSDIIVSKRFIHYRREPEKVPETERPLHPSKRKRYTLPWETVTFAILVESGPNSPAVEISLHDDQNPSKSGSLFIPCKRKAVAAAVYELLFQYRDKMLNPDIMDTASISDAVPKYESSSTKHCYSFSSQVTLNQGKGMKFNSSLQRGTTTAHKAAFDYKFGDANNVDVSDGGVLPGYKSFSELLVDTRKRLLSISDDFGSYFTAESAQRLDETMWWLLFHWNYGGFSSPSETTNLVCSAALLLNNSDDDLYLQRTDVVLGSDVWLLSGRGDDEHHSHSILVVPARSYVAVFATALAASTYQSGKVEVTLHFSNLSSDTEKKSDFAWNLSNQDSRCKIKNEYNEVITSNTLHVEFLEKTVAENWSKCVIIVRKSDF